MDAVVGDSEFWLLAKRVVASGGTVDSNDTVFSLNAKLTNAMGSGSGGGGGTDPGAVQKVGDTMTGTLVITSPDGSAFFDWEDPAGPFSVKIDTSAGGGWPTIHMTAKGVDASIVADVGGNLKLVAGTVLLPATAEALMWQDPGGWVKLQKNGNQDIVATSSTWSGTVNLTNGGVSGGSGLPLTGGTLTGTLVIDDDPNTGIVLKVNDNNIGRSTTVHSYGLDLTAAPGQFTSISASGHDLSIGQAGGVLMASGYPATTKISVDTTTGDVIATAVAGPNVGKSVNLTSGKWA